MRVRDAIGYGAVLAAGLSLLAGDTSLRLMVVLWLPAALVMFVGAAVCDIFRRPW